MQAAYKAYKIVFRQPERDLFPASYIFNSRIGTHFDSNQKHIFREYDYSHGIGYRRNER